MLLIPYVYLCMYGFRYRLRAYESAKTPDRNTRTVEHTYWYLVSIYLYVTIPKLTSVFEGNEKERDWRKHSVMPPCLLGLSFAAVPWSIFKMIFKMTKMDITTPTAAIFLSRLVNHVDNHKKKFCRNAVNMYLVYIYVPVRA